MLEYLNFSQPYKYFQIFAELYFWVYPDICEVNNDNKCIRLKVALEKNGQYRTEEEVLLFSSNESYKIKRLKFTAYPLPSGNSEVVTFIVILTEITKILVAYKKQSQHYELFNRYYFNYLL